MSALLGPIPVPTAIERYTQILSVPRTHRDRLGAGAGRPGRVDGHAGSLRAGAGPTSRRPGPPCTSSGLRVRGSRWSILAGLIELLADQPAEAEDSSTGCEDCERHGGKARAGQPAGPARTGRVRLGPVRRGPAVRRGREQAAGLDETSHVPVLCVRAKALAKLDDPHQADMLARQAVAAAPADLPVVRADALLGLAEVCEVGGKPAESIRAAQQALEIYQRKGNIVSARRTEEVLRRLRA